ncbi:nucleoside/nucleotide kinase family protein [Nocardia testacea]|uniref:nucleoside/nucleotide kinase family protein n=1 Tax=Nocardia testacea TaxID=248551 RepID=UPI003C2FB505
MAGTTDPQTISIKRLAERVHAVARRVGAGQRYVLGIAGPPAAGKSTFAGKLCFELNQLEIGVAGVAPMDGFHRTTRNLAEAGELNSKGQPHSFDVGGFVASVQALRGPVGEASISWPIYDRTIHDPVPNGVVFDTQKIAVVEGNYLLLDEPGWSAVRGLLDECWYVDADISVIERRLYERHIAGGRSSEEARAKIATSDMPNARLIAGTAVRADLVLAQHGEVYFIRAPR